LREAYAKTGKWELDTPEAAVIAEAAAVFGIGKLIKGARHS
jgi:hypothetical protein